MAQMYITSKELIKTLKISAQDLLDVETFFDAIPDDEWELEEGKDYQIVKKDGLREYTTSGAYTIARYLDSTRKRGFWQAVKELIFHTEREIRRAFIRKKILDNCSSLMKRNNRFFISKSDVVTIFGTKSNYLKKMDEHARRTQSSLIKGEDYDDFADEGLYYSLSGIIKLAAAFKECHSKKNRREECWETGQVIESQVDDIVGQILLRDKQIQRAIDGAKKRDKKACRVSGTKWNRVDGPKFAAHHLYSKNEYPHLADVENNLITLTCEVHDQFHQFMGGTHQPCTIDDFITFVQRYYPSSSQVMTWLEQQKLVLGNQQPIDKRKAHVLYLPASRVA